MRNQALKLAAISALRAQPDFSTLRQLHGCSRQDSANFLTWLDQSGLALYLFGRLRDCGESGVVPPHIIEALGQRAESNSKRMEEMIREFSKVNSELRNRAIPHAFLKGFTLAPEFSPDPALRHQTDIDILVHPDFMAEAAEALIACGYSPRGSEAEGQLKFATPLQYVPSAHDDVYRVPAHREAELHTSIWEETGAVSLRVPSDCLARARACKLREMEFFALSSEDMFLMQAFHAFSHLLGSWVRISWLWEIEYFLRTRAGDKELWRRIIARAGDDQNARKAIGLVLFLTKELFGGSVPEAMNEWCVKTLPYRVETWARHFGIRWALSELGGNKVTLFIHHEFVNDASKWKSYLLRRLIPIPGRPSIGHVEASDVKTRLRGRGAEWTFAGRRLAFHASEMFRLTWEAFRWRQALQTCRKGRIASP